MVATVRPRWSVERVRPSQEGTDAVYFLSVRTPTGPREVVLKAFPEDVVSPAAAAAEPRIVELLAAKTDVPVPEVIDFVDEHPDLPAPFFLTERLAGENGSGRFEELPPTALERVLAEAGDYLGQLHEVRSFDRFGRLGVEDGDLAVVGDAYGRRERWTDWLLANVEHTLDGIAGGRFDDLVPAIREYAGATIPGLADPEEGAIVHWDYRLGNLLIDPGTGATEAVLDWANLLAGDPVYNLVTVEDHNVNWQTQDPVLRGRLREAFLGAYRDRRGGDLRDDFRERKRLYHLCNRLNAMTCLPDWYDDEATRDRRGAVHRAFVREYLD